MPRFVFSDVPLGNPFGPPDDVETQQATLELAFDMLEHSRFPRSTVQAPWHWPVQDWRKNYMLVDDSNRADLAAAGDRRRVQQARAKI